MLLEDHPPRLCELVRRQTCFQMFTELEDVGEILTGCATRRGDRQPAVGLHQVDGNVSIVGVVETDDDLGLSIPALCCGLIQPIGRGPVLLDALALGIQVGQTERRFGIALIRRALTPSQCVSKLLGSPVIDKKAGTQPRLGIAMPLSGCDEVPPLSFFSSERRRSCSLHWAGPLTCGSWHPGCRRRVRVHHGRTA